MPTAILQSNPVVAQPVQDYLRAHRRLTFSVITRYEILRGLKARDAMVQQEAFERFCAASTVLPLTDAIVVHAADIYADLQRRGELIGDADILIAATALVDEHDLATNNERHFVRVKGLNIDNWLK